MLLRDYLHFKKISALKFAQDIGAHPNHIRQIANGHREPGLELAVKIFHATNGEVKIRELKPSYKGPLCEFME